jgi:hypothetical protein
MAIPEQTRDEDHASTLKQLTQDLKQANRLVQQLVDALNLMEPVKKFTRRPAGIEGGLKVTLKTSEADLRTQLERMEANLVSHRFPNWRRARHAGPNS